MVGSDSSFRRRVIVHYIVLSALLPILMVSCETYDSPLSCIESECCTKIQKQNQDLEEHILMHLRTSKSDDFRYFFQSFHEQEENTYMSVSFRSQTQCFDVNVLVDRWDKLAGMHKVNGRSYPKELRNLRWEILNNRIVRYIDMEPIVD